MRKSIVLLIFLMCFGLSYGQQETLTWSIGTPVVDCDVTPTTISYPLQVQISDDLGGTAYISTSTLSFLFDNNYIENFSVDNVQNGYTIGTIQENNNIPIGTIFGFSTSTGSQNAFDVNLNPANPLLINDNTPTTILDLKFDVTSVGETLGLANNSLCTPIVLDNDHSNTVDSGYFPNFDGIAGVYGNPTATEPTQAEVSAEDEVIYYGWEPNLSYDGTFDINDPQGDIGSTDLNNCTPYLCGVEFIQTISGPWDVATNWIDDVVPTVNDDAIIDAGVESYLTQDQAVNNLELRPGSTVSIPAGSTLNIKGNVINDGDFTLYNTTFPSGTVGNPNVDGEVLLDGPANQDLSGTGNYYNLRVNNSLGVDVLNTDTTDPTEINGALFIDDGDFSTSDNVLFPCDFGTATGPSPFTRHAVGQIGPVAAGSSIVGNVTVEQCFPGRRAFRLVSPSTTGGSIHDEWQENPSSYTDDPRPGYGAHITGVVPDPASNALGQQSLDQTNGLDWQPSGNVSMFSFNTNQSWDNVLDTETPTLNAGDPYLMMIRGSRAVNLESNASPTSDTKLESTGTPNVNPSAINPGIGSGEYALIGNPFHAVVDLTEVIPGNGYTGFVTIYDPNIGGTANVNPSSTELGGRGGYVTVDVSGGTTTGSTSIITSGITDVTATDATQFIQPYQAFFVQGASSGTPGTITFEETDKRVEEIQTDVFSSSQARISVTLFDQVSLNNQDTPDDGLVVYFSPNSSNAVDDNDAPKFFNQDEVIARNENGSLVSFENRAMPVEEDVLELYTDQYRTTNYVLEVGVQFLPNQTVYLHDKYTDTEVLLNNNASNTYAFTVDQSNPGSIATDRFEILFQSTTLGTNDFDLQGLSVYPNPASDILNISLGENIGRFDSVELFDISGRLVAKQAIGNQLEQTQLDVNTFSSGVYLLKVSSKTEQFTTKVIIE